MAMTAMKTCDGLCRRRQTYSVSEKANSKECIGIIHMSG